MKILHIIDSGGLYGAEAVLLNLVSEQITMGLGPTIASIGEKNIPEKPLEIEAQKKGFKVKKYRMRPGPNIHGMFKVLRYAQQNKFNILHSHGYKGNVAFGLMPKRFRKVPLISTLHGWTSVSGFSKNRVYEWLDLISLKYIDAVVLVSEAMKSHPRLKNLNSVNFHVIPNGIPIKDAQFNDSTNQPFNHSMSHGKFNDPTNQQFNKSPTRFDDSTTHQFDQNIIDFCNSGYTIGSIGRLSYEKGYRYLIEALYLLVKKVIDARLVIIGEGYERDFLQDLALQFNLNDRIMLPGYRDRAKKYLPYFKVFVISSLTEGLPITLLEAMQAKIPIVATRVGGMPEVLQNGRAALLAQPRKPDALATAISRLYYDQNLAQELSAMAYQRVTTIYDSKTMASNYLKIYNDLIN